MPRHLDETDRLLCEAKFATPEELTKLEEHLNSPVRPEQEEVIQKRTDRARVAELLRDRSEQPSLQS